MKNLDELLEARNIHISEALSLAHGHPLHIVKGEMQYLHSADGTRYLDFTSGIGVNCLGHSHPSLVNALKSQAEKIWHCSNLFKIGNQKRACVTQKRLLFTEIVIS